MAGKTLAELNRSGIYQILNSVNGKRYVGSAKNVRRRWGVHRYDLSGGVHHNPGLQYAWRKYGSHAFVFSVLEFCTPESLISTEQKYFDLIRPEYNIQTVAGSSAGTVTSEKTKALLASAITGKKRSEETKARMRIAQRLRTFWPSQSPEVKARISATMKGRPRPRTEAHSQKIGLSKRKLSDSDVAKMAELHHAGVTLAEIAKRFGCSLSMVSQLRNGKKRKGSWKLISAPTLFLR